MCEREQNKKERDEKQEKFGGGTMREDSRPTGDRLFVPFDDAGRRPRGGAHPAAALPGLELHGVLRVLEAVQQGTGTGTARRPWRGSGRPGGADQRQRQGGLRGGGSDARRGSGKVLGPFDAHHAVHIFLLTWPNENVKKHGSLTFRNV